MSTNKPKFRARVWQVGSNSFGVSIDSKRGEFGPGQAGAFWDRLPSRWRGNKRDGQHVGIGYLDANPETPHFSFHQNEGWDAGAKWAPLSKRALRFLEDIEALGVEVEYEIDYNDNRGYRGEQFQSIVTRDEWVEQVQRGGRTYTPMSIQQKEKDNA